MGFQNRIRDLLPSPIRTKIDVALRVLEQEHQKSRKDGRRLQVDAPFLAAIAMVVNERFHPDKGNMDSLIDEIKKRTSLMNSNAFGPSLHRSYDIILNALRLGSRVSRMGLMDETARAVIARLAQEHPHEELYIEHYEQARSEAEREPQILTPNHASPGRG